MGATRCGPKLNDCSQDLQVFMGLLFMGFKAIKETFIS